jgi:hypothetical protein
MWPRNANGRGTSNLRQDGMDRSALSKLETGQRANLTVETLVRYAEDAGKRLVVSLTDATSCDVAKWEIWNGRCTFRRL